MKIALLHYSAPRPLPLPGAPPRRGAWRRHARHGPPATPS